MSSKLDIIYLTKQPPDRLDSDLRDRPTIEITPEMVDAGRLALIDWFEGECDFASGAESVFSAMLTNAKAVDLYVCRFASRSELPDL